MVNTAIVYKLVRKRKDGTLGPLFINAKLRIPMHEWLEAENHPTKGFAHRPGWHCTLEPIAPHLSERGRVWVECICQNFQKFSRPQSQGGTWVLAERIKFLREVSQEEVEERRCIIEQVLENQGVKYEK